MNPKLIEEIHALRQQLPDGRWFVDKVRLVSWAQKHPTSLCHAEFEWDNEKAAHEYRLEQARKLIARVVIIIESPGGPPVECRAYTSVPIDGGPDREYIEIRDVLSDPQARRRLIVSLLTNALAETNSWPQLNELDNWRKNTRQLIIKFKD